MTDWSDRPLAPGEAIEAPGCRVAAVETGHQALVTGDLAAAMEALAPGAPMLGCAEAPDGPAYAIRIARDHALFVTPAPPGRPEGWHAPGFALSAAGEARACLALGGPGAADLLAHLLMAPLPEGSPSAAVRLGAGTALVTGAPGGLRLWVERGHLGAASALLRRAARDGR